MSGSAAFAENSGETVKNPSGEALSLSTVISGLQDTVGQINAIQQKRKAAKILDDSLSSVANKIVNDVSRQPIHYFCPFCCNGYTSDYSLENHLVNKHKIMLQQPKSNSWKCAFCLACFYSQSTVVLHASQYHQDQLFYFLQRDNKISTTSNEISCSLCGNSWEKFPEFMKHFITLHSNSIQELLFPSVESNSLFEQKEASEVKLTDPKSPGLSKEVERMTLSAAKPETPSFSSESRPNPRNTFSEDQLDDLINELQQYLNEHDDSKENLSPVKRLSFRNSIENEQSFQISIGQGRERQQIEEILIKPRSNGIFDFGGSPIPKQGMNELAKSGIATPDVFMSKALAHHCKSPPSTSCFGKPKAKKMKPDARKQLQFLTSTPRCTKLPESFKSDDSKVFQCNQCSEKFGFNSLLVLHLKRNHKALSRAVKPLYSCGLCGAKFFKNKYLKKHVASHKDQKKPRCLKSSFFSALSKNS